MKIVIIGAGISGLSTYLFLRKHLPNPSPPAEPHSIRIYETHNTARGLIGKDGLPSRSHDQSANSIGVGGGLGVVANGLKVLKRLDESLFHDIVRHGHAMHAFKMSNARGWQLASLPVKSRDDPPFTCLMIARQELWNSLRVNVPDSAITTKTVNAVVATAGEQKNVLNFADGSPDEEFDLVIGADSLKSVVRKAMFRTSSGDDNKREDAFPAHYEGLVGVGGFIPSSFLTSTGVAPGEMGLVFGSDGFFGYGYSTSSPDEPERHLPHVISKSGAEAVWWSTYELAACADWRNIDREDIKRQLISRHSGWKNATVRKVIESVEVDTVWPTWTIPELPTYERDGLVLVGDAAHALQPTSGQGVSQALEDCESFVLLLTHYLKDSYLHPQSTQLATETEARAVAAKKYVDMRMPRIKAIQWRSQQMGNMKRKMGVVQEMLLYLILWMVGLFGSFDSYNQKLINYDVPAEVAKVVRQ